MASICKPVTVDEFRIAVAETYDDVIVSLRGEAYIPSSHNPWTRIEVALEGHYFYGERVKCCRSPLDTTTLLTMEDMGMGGWDMIWQEWTTARWRGMDNSGDDDVDGYDLPDGRDILRLIWITAA